MIAEGNAGHRAALKGRLGRRELLAGAVGIAALTMVRPAIARPSLDAAMAAFAGGREVQPGRVRFDIPPLVENGNAVGVSNTVDSPMTAQDHVTRIALFNEKNPQADMVVFHRGPRAGRAACRWPHPRTSASRPSSTTAAGSFGSAWVNSISPVRTATTIAGDSG